jgi:SP family sugar:H+ symporter-like MFS transporter
MRADSAFTGRQSPTFPLLAEHGLGIAYSLYVGFALLALLFMWKSLPETRGRALT